jgi:hypothetical protein
MIATVIVPSGIIINDVVLVLVVGVVVPLPQPPCIFSVASYFGETLFSVLLQSYLLVPGVGCCTTITLVLVVLLRGTSDGGGSGEGGGNRGGAATANLPGSSNVLVVVEEVGGEGAAL